MVSLLLFGSFVVCAVVGLVVGCNIVAIFANIASTSGVVEPLFPLSGKGLRFLSKMEAFGVNVRIAMMKL